MELRVLFSDNLATYELQTPKHGDYWDLNSMSWTQSGLRGEEKKRKREGGKAKRA